MKVLLFLLGFVTVSFGYPIAKTWTFHELSKALPNKNIFAKNTDPDKEPLIKAFDMMMSAIFTGKPDHVNALLLSPTGEKLWTKTQLEQAFYDENTNMFHIPFIERAYKALSNYNTNTANNGTEKDTIEVWIIALDISTWTEDDITKALKDTSINPDLQPYLKNAQKELDEAFASGKTKEKVTLITPVGLIPPPVGVVPAIVPKSTNNESTNKV